MIRFLRRHELASKKPTPVKLFSAFLKSKNITEFLSNLGLDESEISRFLSSHDPIAKEYYLNLTRKYKDATALEEEKEEEERNSASSRKRTRSTKLVANTDDN
jgi:reverse gyrase